MAKGELKNNIVDAVKKAVEIEVETREVIVTFTDGIESLSGRVEKLVDKAGVQNEIMTRLANESMATLKLREAIQAQKRHDRHMMILAGLIVVQIVVTIGARLVH